MMNCKENGKNQTKPARKIINTADNSPTLSLEQGEKMHSLQGAFSESLYIYGFCLEKVIQPTQSPYTISTTKTGPATTIRTDKQLCPGKPRILSLGLGLGYNELITHGFLLKTKKSHFSLVSFEKKTELVHFFISWLKGKKSPLDQCYNQILKRVSEHFNETPEKLKEFCYQNLKHDFFQILRGLPSKNPFDFCFTAILYDAFSSRSNPELWTEDHLKTFIKSYCDSRECCFATYAATGDLKRVLKSEGFQLMNRRGFAGKRESTFAFRNL